MGGDDDRLALWLLLALPCTLLASTADTAAPSDEEDEPSEWRGGSRPDGAIGPMVPLAFGIKWPPCSVGGEDEYEEEATAGAATVAEGNVEVEAKKNGS